jgi:hypothetical protein
MRAPLSLLLPCFLFACVDYEIKPDGDDPGEPLEDTGEPECPPQIPDCNDTEEPEDTEVVVVDPGDCDIKLADPGTVEIAEECEGSGTSGTVTDPFNLTIEMSYTSAGSGAIVMPAVGNLNDDNGDGRVDETDIPDIVFTTWMGNTLVALNGADGSEIFEVSGYNGQGGVTIADVDSDGEPEIIAFTTGNNIAAVNNAGVAKWKSAVFGVMSYPQPTVADLDADGKPEVIGDIGVVNGEDGSTVATLTGITNSWRTPIAADLDQDGKQEIILGNRVFSATGALLWSNSGTGAGNFSAVADVDGDPGGEVFFVSGSQLFLHDDDGSLIRATTIPGSNPGPPSVADFDGDGEIEIAIPANTTISLWKIDGTKVWQMPMQDSSGLAGCSGYDMDGDGAYEVLFADEDALRMYDGATGAILYENYTHSSGTVWEYPVIADVDQDGSAEIVIASNVYSGAGVKGVTVFGHAGDGWPQSGPTWGTHDFAVTNLNPDGSVPITPEASWQKYNVFRARPSVDDPSAADLTVSYDDLCVADCNNGPIKISFQVANKGAVDVEAGTPWAFYKVDGEAITLVKTGTLDAIPAGTSLQGFALELVPGDIGVNGFLMTVDDDGAGGSLHSECDEDNNTVVWLDRICS